VSVRLRCWRTRPHRNLKQAGYSTSKRQRVACLWVLRSSDQSFRCSCIETHSGCAASSVLDKSRDGCGPPSGSDLRRKRTIRTSRNQSGVSSTIAGRSIWSQRGHVVATTIVWYCAECAYPFKKYGAPDRMGLPTETQRPTFRLISKYGNLVFRFSRMSVSVFIFTVSVDVAALTRSAPASGAPTTLIR
jgi:hypothetical protein